MRASITQVEWNALPADLRAAAIVSQPATLPGVKARGRTPYVPGRMNKLELQYEQFLNEQLRAGEILWHGFEKITLRLANRCTLTVDFTILTTDSFIELHDTKGHMEDDFAAKLRVAATMFPFFTFYVVRKTRDGWQVKEWK